MRYLGYLMVMEVCVVNINIGDEVATFAAMYFMEFLSVSSK